MVDQPVEGFTPHLREPGAANRWRAAFDSAFEETRDAWSALSVYERFEQIVSLTLTLLISLVILAAVLQLMLRILALLLQGIVDPADQTVFQAIFGMIMTVHHPRRHQGRG